MRDDDHSIVWKVAAGVAVGIVAAALVLYAIERYRTQLALQEMVQAFDHWVRGVQKTTTQSQQAQREAERERAAAEAAARKQRAWDKHYRKPPQCDGDPNQQQMIDCANHYIRAKREFEAAYAAGKF